MCFQISMPPAAPWPTSFVGFGSRPSGANTRTEEPPKIVDGKGRQTRASRVVGVTKKAHRTWADAVSGTQRVAPRPQ